MRSRTVWATCKKDRRGNKIIQKEEEEKSITRITRSIDHSLSLSLSYILFLPFCFFFFAHFCIIKECLTYMENSNNNVLK